MYPESEKCIGNGNLVDNLSLLWKMHSMTFDALSIYFLKTAHLISVLGVDIHRRGTP
jgi:hypothetical protein